MKKQKVQKQPTVALLILGGIVLYMILGSKSEAAPPVDALPNTVPPVTDNTVLNRPGPKNKRPGGLNKPNPIYSRIL